MKTTKIERSFWRCHASEFGSLNMDGNAAYRLLDDADRCEKLERAIAVVVNDLRDEAEIRRYLCGVIDSMEGVE